MAKNRQDEAQDENKKPQTFRFSVETIRTLAVAARETRRSKTAYVEFALKNQFRKDRISLE
jgi:hypothetical protein